MLRRTLLAAGFIGLAAAATPSVAEELKELNVGVLSTDTSAALKKNWEPLIADLGKAIGMKANGFYASDYAGVIEAMRFNKVQVSWFGNASAVPAVDRAEGEVFGRGTGVDGTQGYYSLLIVNKDSPIHSLEDIIKSPGTYTFGNGDPNSTSGFLMPSYYAWAKNHIDITKQFKRIAVGNHQSNMVAVANKQVDVATNNTEDMAKFAKSQPDKVAEVREIWRSPLIPGDPLVYRKDLPADLKAKIKAFFVAYGTPAAGPGWEKQKENLANLSYGPIRASDNTQLVPIRQIMLFRDKIKLQDDANMSAEEKTKRIGEI
ncbi:MAG TPA: phosphonate ABC transporter substrate-binding protein, partial [Stellaceae bacterium]|nr:phosphonate ABC transporter substrate-binding protein [Stellaceae bacterium]